MNTQEAQLPPSTDSSHANDHSTHIDVVGDGDGSHVDFNGDDNGTHIDVDDHDTYKYVDGHRYVDVDNHGTHSNVDDDGNGIHTDVDGHGTHADVDDQGTHSIVDGHDTHTDVDGTHTDVDDHGTHTDVDRHGTHTDVYDQGTHTNVDGDDTHTDVDDHGTHTDVDRHGTHTDVDDQGTHTNVDGDDTHTDVDGDGDGTHIDVDDHSTHKDVNGRGTHSDVDEDGNGIHTDVDGHGTHADVDDQGTHSIADGHNTRTEVDGDGDGTHTDIDDHDTHTDVDRHGTHTDIDDQGTHTNVDGYDTHTDIDGDGDGTHIDVDDHSTHKDVNGGGTHPDVDDDGDDIHTDVVVQVTHTIVEGDSDGTYTDVDDHSTQTDVDCHGTHTNVDGHDNHTDVDGDDDGTHIDVNDHGTATGQLQGQVVVDLSNMNTSFKSEESPRISKNYEDDGHHLLRNTIVEIEDEKDLQQLQNIASSEILEEEKDWNALERFGDSHLGRKNLPEDEGQKLWKYVAKIVEKKDLNALRTLGGAEQVFFKLGPLLEARKAAGDDPEFLECTRTPVYEIGSSFLQACKSRTNVLLLLLGVLVLALGMWEKGPKKGWHDGFGILMALFLILSFTSVSRFRLAGQMKKRLIEENGLQVEVMRSGPSHLVPICKIAEGNIVRLRKGSLVPADGLLVGGNSLMLDGVLDKNISCDQNPFLYAGSKVIQGDGLMLVTSAGNATELGTAMSWVTDHADDKLQLEPARLRKHDPYADIKNLTKEPLLEGRINKPIALVDDSALIISIILVGLIILVRYLIRRDINYEVSQEVKGEVGVKGVMDNLKVLLNSEGKVGILAAFLAAVVMGLQHGIPFVISGCLSYWNEGSRSSNITLTPKSLSACGTLGLVRVLCIDISGGILTGDRMEVNRFWIGEEDIADDDDDDSRSEMSPVVLDALSRGVGAMGLVRGIPLTSTDDALICWAKFKWGFKMELLEQRTTAVCDGKLSSNKEGSGVLLRNSGDDENILHLHWKGDAKTILDLCSRYYECGGEIHAIERQKSTFEKVIKEMEDSGLQPVAFAYKQTEVIELEENELILLALVGVKQYYCQEEMKSVVRTFKNAGISIKLVSQDDLATSRAIAWELGLLSPGSDDDGQALKGQEFRGLSNDIRTEIADQISLLWSSLPMEKLLMVKSLKQRGHVVAFLGGLTARDAPVLKEADIGITAGNWSTQLAVEISDIDVGKSLTSLIPILASGRLAYRSIQKFIHVHVTSNLTILLTTTVESICLGETSITIFHLLYLNLILGIVGGFMLVTKPRNQQLGSIELGKRNAWIITKAMWGNTLIQVLYQVAVLLMFEFKGEAVPGMKHINQKVRKAVIFISFILYQVPSYISPVPVPLIPETAKLFDLHNYRFVGVVGAFTVLQVVGVTEFWVRLKWVHLAFCSLISLISWVIRLATVFLSLLIKRRAS